MLLVNTINDVIRLVPFVLGVWTLVLLIRKRFDKNDTKTWSQAHFDLWLGLLMWVITGLLLIGAAIYEDIDFGLRAIFYSIAMIVTFSGVRKKGRWGDECDSDS